MKTLYIAGPMRGYPRFNFDAFDAAEKDLTEKGYVVHSPATMDRRLGFDPDVHTLDQFDMRAAVKRDVTAIAACDAVVVLPGYEKSTGATAELWVAKWLGLPVVVYPSMAPLGAKVEPDVLEEALQLTSGDRQNAYGPPEQDFARTAGMWTAYLDGRSEIRAQDVAWMMMLLKSSRATWSDKRDHYVDAAGYARCGWKCVEAKK